MRNSLKLLLAVLTAIPLIYVFLFFLGLIEAFYGSVVRGSWDALMYRWISFPTLFRINMFVIAWNLLLAVIYLVHVATNNRLKSEPKIAWAALIIGGSLFSMAAYWYLNIWRKPRFAKNHVLTSTPNKIVEPERRERLSHQA
jgi:hypothetical protein